MSKSTIVVLSALLVLACIGIFIAAAIGQAMDESWAVQVSSQGIQNVVLKDGTRKQLVTNGDYRKFPECTWQGKPACPPPTATYSPPTQVPPTVTPADWVQRTMVAVGAEATGTSVALKVEATKAFVKAQAAGTSTAIAAIATAVTGGQKAATVPTITSVPTITPKPTITPIPTNVPAVATAVVNATLQALPPTPAAAAVRAKEQGDVGWETGFAEARTDISKIGGTAATVIVVAFFVALMVGILLLREKLIGIAEGFGALFHGLAKSAEFIGKGFLGVFELLLLPGKLPAPYGAISIGFEFLIIVLIVLSATGVLKP